MAIGESINILSFFLSYQTILEDSEEVLCQTYVKSHFSSPLNSDGRALTLLCVYASHNMLEKLYQEDFTKGFFLSRKCVIQMGGLRLNFLRT